MCNHTDSWVSLRPTAIRLNQLHLKVWRLWCSLVKPYFLPEHLKIVYFSPPQLPLTHTPAIHTLLFPSVAVSSGHTPCHLTHLIGVLPQLSSGPTPLLSYHVPKTRWAQPYDTRDYTSQGVRLTGCWIVFDCWHYHVWTPEPQKKKNWKWALLLGTALNTIYTWFHIIPSIQPKKWASLYLGGQPWG